MDRSEWVRVPRVPTGAMLEAELIALVAGPYHYHHKMDEHAEREGKAFDRCRELTIQNIRTWCATRRAMLAAPPPPAEQASGEAVQDALETALRYVQHTAGGKQSLLVSKLESAIAALSQRPVVTYRLLRDGETILETDEHLSDDANSWWPVGNSLGRGCAYRSGFFMPIRRLAPQQPTTPVFSSGGNGGSSGVKQPTGEEG